MNNGDLQRLFELLVAGDITSEDHAILQQKLKEDAYARAAFRERMDLEAGLRTWASESAPPLTPAEQATNETTLPARRISSMWRYLPAVVVAASILIMARLQPWNHFVAPAKRVAKDGIVNPTVASHLVGSIRQQADCEWVVRPVSTSGRIAIGKMELSNGVVELRFDSGTDVILEGPCTFDITSIDSARLHAGNVCVNVGELSNGFTLQTPEAQIIDEGTEYAVSLDDDSTDVHVFDGSVIWIPTTADAQSPTDSFEDRVEAGEAMSYPHSDPTKPKRIPLGKRQFVRRLEEQLREQSEGSLVVYDGFENLAQRVRRGRSGFGWSDGWQPSGRGRGKIGEIVDCSEEVVFGFDRSQRRLMLLERGLDIRRNFAQPLSLVTGESIYVSALISRQPISSEPDGSSLQISLEPDLPGRGRRLHQIISFGVATDGFPFIGSGNTVTKTATKVAVGETVFCVLKLAVTDEETNPALRIYRSGEVIDDIEPSAWTVTGQAGSTNYQPASLRITTGDNASCQIDELKIATSWQAARLEDG